MFKTRVPAGILPSAQACVETEYTGWASAANLTSRSLHAQQNFSLEREAAWAKGWTKIVHTACTENAVHPSFCSFFKRKKNRCTLPAFCSGCVKKVEALEERQQSRAQIFLQKMADDMLPNFFRVFILLLITFCVMPSSRWKIPCQCLPPSPKHTGTGLYMCSTSVAARSRMSGVAQVRRIAQEQKLHLSSIPQHGGIDV